MSIKYEAYTWSGKKVKGVVDTDSEEAAYELLQRDELIPYRLLPVRPRPSVVQLALSLFRPKSQHVVDFTREVSSLLRSGIALPRALTAQRDQVRGLGLREALRQIVQDVEAGGRVSDAFGGHPSVFPDFYVRLLRVGEATGSLPGALEQLSETMERRNTVRNRVKSALTYPAISLGVAFIATLVLVKYSLPALTDLMKEFGGELPPATQMLISITDFLEVYVGYVLLSIFAGVVIVAVAMRTRAGKWFQDSLLLKIPVVGGILMSSNMFLLASTMVTLMKAGVPTIEALRLTEEGLSNVILRRKLAIVRKEASEGVKLGEAVSRQTIFPVLLSQSIAVGEMRGTQIDTLSGLANYYEQQTERSIAGATELIQPAIILLVSGVVGFVAVAVISGIYSSLSAVQ